MIVYHDHTHAHNYMQDGGRRQRRDRLCARATRCFDTIARMASFRTCSDTHTNTHTRARTHTHARARARTHTHTPTHTHSQPGQACLHPAPDLLLARRRRVLFHNNGRLLPKRRGLVGLFSRTAAGQYILVSRSEPCDMVAVAIALR